MGFDESWRYLGTNRRVVAALSAPPAPDAGRDVVEHDASAAPPTWRALIVGGLAFRLFDQIKPWPARRAERLGGGAGVMLDDVAAGVWGAALVLAGRALGWL